MLARSARQLRTLHDALCVRRAWPTDREDLTAVEKQLSAFASRSDLKRFRRVLANSGIAGTDLHCQPYFHMALWIARDWPESLRIDWDEFDNDDELIELLPLLFPHAESLFLDSYDRTAREWIDELGSSSESDGSFLVRRFAEGAGDDLTRQYLFERLEPPLVLETGSSTPSRTTAWHKASPVVFGPAPKGRPSMPATIREMPLRERRAGGAEGKVLLGLARASLLLRDRDLDAFAHGNPKDVFVVDWPQGLQVAVIGMRPERRLLLESCFGHLVLQNGVPIGYGTLSALFQSVEVAYNIFPAFRGHGASWVMGRLLATAHHLFGATSFYSGPYQLGHDNEEGIRSGAWWYYEKLGFRPDVPAAARLRKSELRRLRDDPGHRTRPAVLLRLAEHPMFLDLGSRREDVLGRLDLGVVGEVASRQLRSHGWDRESGIRECVRAVRNLLTIQSRPRWTPAERSALQNWAPLVMALPRVGRWSISKRRALANVIRAKGGPQQREFVTRFDAHHTFRRAIVALCAR